MCTVGGIRSTVFSLHDWLTGFGTNFWCIVYSGHPNTLTSALFNPLWCTKTVKPFTNHEQHQQRFTVFIKTPDPDIRFGHQGLACDGFTVFVQLCDAPSRKISPSLPVHFTIVKLTSQGHALNFSRAGGTNSVNRKNHPSNHGKQTL
jgi:hypothetical protein